MLSRTPFHSLRMPIGAKVRSKKPPIPLAPDQLVSTDIRDAPASVGVTVQTVRRVEFWSASMRV